MNNIAVIRISSLGDVALLYPVIRFMYVSHPLVKIHLVSAPFHQAIFEDCPNVNFIAFKKGDRIFGLFSHLKSLEIDAVIDAHNVMRTWILRALFLCTKTPFLSLNKERSKRKKLLKLGWKKAQSITQVSYRYAALFEKIGLDISNFQPSEKLFKPKASLTNLEAALGYKKSGTWIAIAPFAKHKSKMYPPHRMQQLIRLLLKKNNSEKIFILGSQTEIRDIKNQWEIFNHKSISSIPQNTSFKGELGIISHMDLVISMDSANMHLASMYGIPVVSIWGSTHPYIGFYGFGQKSSYAIQSQDENRPCSIFGKSPCGKENCPHFEDIFPQNIIDKVDEILKVKTLLP